MASTASEQVRTQRPPRPARRLRRDAAANQERVLAAAVSTMMREGRHVPMATIAAEAGLGVATLYRRYPHRDALLDALTHRSFGILLTVAEQAEAREDSALASLSWWWDRVIEARDQLVLPLGGGPSVMGAPTSAIRSQLHRSLERLIARGQREGSIRADVTLRDIVLFGAMLVSPPPGVAGWDRMARRQKEIYLDGLSHTRRGELTASSGAAVDPVLNRSR
jgi:AcrR family transcriptional regulator